LNVAPKQKKRGAAFMTSLLVNQLKDVMVFWTEPTNGDPKLMKGKGWAATPGQKAAQIKP